MLFKILYGFLPWIIFDALPKTTPEQFNRAVLLILGITVISNYKTIKKRFILPISTVIFFSLIYLSEMLYPNTWIIINISILSNITLVLIAWGSLIFKCPFTLQYAREQRPPEKWNHPVFVFINKFLTSIWGIIFLFNLIINIFTVYYNVIGHLLNSILTNGSTLLGLLIVIWFPAWYPNHLKTKAVK